MVIFEWSAQTRLRKLIESRKSRAIRYTNSQPPDKTVILTDNLSLLTYLDGGEFLHGCSKLIVRIQHIFQGMHLTLRGLKKGIGTTCILGGKERRIHTTAKGHADVPKPESQLPRCLDGERWTLCEKLICFYSDACMCCNTVFYYTPVLCRPYFTMGSNRSKMSTIIVIFVPGFVLP